MAKRKTKDVYAELSEENHKSLQRIAKKTGLEWEQVAGMILACEADIIRYSAGMRKKLAKRLKIRPTRRFLYMPRFCD